MNKKKMTQHDVAKEAGVSQRTVSRVFNNLSSVVGEKRDKVIQAAQKLGYRKNSLASGLASLKAGLTTIRGTIACITGHTDSNHLTQVDSYRRIYSGIVERAAELGYQLEHFWRYAPEYTNYRLERTLWARGITGVIFLGIHESEIQLNWSEFSCIYAMGIDRPDHEVRFNCIENDYYKSTSFAVKKAVAAGRKKVVYVTSLSELWKQDGQGRAAFCEKMKEYNLDTTETIFVRDTDKSEQRNKQLFLDWFSKKKPEVIIAKSELNRIRSDLTEINISIPEDVEYIDTHMYDQEKDKNLSGYFVPFEHFGITAVDLLAGDLIHENRGYPKVKKLLTIPGIWNPGQTFIIDRRKTK